MNVEYNLLKQSLNLKRHDEKWFGYSYRIKTTKLWNLVIVGRLMEERAKNMVILDVVKGILALVPQGRGITNTSVMLVGEGY